MNVKRQNGEDALRSVYLEVLNGDLDPSDGLDQPRVGAARATHTPHVLVGHVQHPQPVQGLGNRRMRQFVPFNRSRIAPIDPPDHERHRH